MEQIHSNAAVNGRINYAIATFYLTGNIKGVKHSLIACCHMSIGVTFLV
jgi:hypothetical protein